MNRNLAIMLGLTAMLATPTVPLSAADALDGFIQRNPGPVAEPPAVSPPSLVPETLPGFEFPIEMIEQHRRDRPRADADLAPSTGEGGADRPMPSGRPMRPEHHGGAMAGGSDAPGLGAHPMQLMMHQRMHAMMHGQMMGGMMMAMPTIAVPVMPMILMPMMVPGMDTTMGMAHQGTQGGGHRPMAGHAMMSPGRDLALDADAVRARVKMDLDWRGNPRLKVGAVETRDDDTIVAEIVTREGALVDRFTVDRHTGWTERIE